MLLRYEIGSIESVDRFWKGEGKGLYKDSIDVKKPLFKGAVKGIWGYLAPLRRLVVTLFIVVQGNNQVTPVMIVMLVV